MNGSRRVPLCLLAVAVLACSAAPVAAELDKDFRAAKGPISLLMRSKDVDNRIKGLHQLQQYPLVDAAKLLVQIGFKSQPAEVRRAAYETLLAWGDNEEIVAYLNELVKRDVHRKVFGEDSLPVVAALVSSQLPNVDQDALELIDKSFGSNKQRALPVLVALADDLGAHGEDADLAALAKLAKTKTFNADFGFRRAVVQGVIHIRTPESLDLLVKLLAEMRGEVRADVVACLQKATGQNFAADPKEWADWWKANRAKFQYPAVAQELANSAPRSLSMATRASYYGIPIYAQRLVFVLDTSGSMRGERLAAAKRELISAINGLDQSDSFNLVIFNGVVNVWRTKLAPADAQTKRIATYFVESQQARGNTATFDALQAAFGFDAEAIYFLTDGEPNGGKVQNPADIVTVIGKANYSRRLSIYALGIGVGMAGGPSDDFLQTLAERNYGSYRRVDQ